MVSTQPFKRMVSTQPFKSPQVPLIPDHRSHIIEGMADRISYNHAGGAPLAVQDDDINGVGGDGGGGQDAGVVIGTKPKTKKPAMYKVIMLNDDYTPMEFVILILESLFNKNSEEATRIMLHVHQKGVGVCGVFTYEVAETKVQQVMDLARQHQHPLQCTLEKA